MGDTIMKRRNTKGLTVREKLAFYSNDLGDCIEWTGPKTNAGYGVLGLGGRNGKDYLAHRLSYEQKYGEIPEGLCACHKCDNRWCVNPDHIFIGTKKDNTHDALRKHRLSCGEDNNLSKLKESDVIDIHSMATSGVMQKTIMAKYNITRTTIYMIKNQQSWRHLWNTKEVFSEHQI
jgi:hypothetical protein